MNPNPSLLVLTAALALHTTAAFAAPVNDHFANRLAFTGSSVSDTTAAATKEAGEPNHALGWGSTASGKSVWYSWTPASSGYAEFTLAGLFNKVLAIYTGTTLTSLTQMVNYCNAGSSSAYGRFDAIAGTEYLIAVDGYGSASGSFTLSLAHTLAPPNDAFANRIALSGTNATTSGANIGACKEPGEPNHAGYSGGHSVWWTWSAPASGRATISTDGAFYKVIAIYTGTELASLTPVANAISSGGIAAASFEAAAGGTYQIAVDGTNKFDFTPSLTVTVALQPPPGNDDFANATALTGTSATVSTATNLSASMESGEPNHAGRTGGHSVWWTWTAPAAGHFVVAATGEFNKLLGIYTGGAVSALTEVARGYGTTGSPAQAGFDATAGTVYHFAVDGEGGSSGSFALELKLPPLNDDFANRFTLTGSSASATANTTTATKETGEPNHAGESGGKSLWWTWTAPAAGRVVITVTTTTGLDPAVAVYTGTDLVSLTAIASGVAYSPGPAYANFDALPGVAYQLAVDGQYGDGGPLTWQLAYVTAPPNDFFANRQAVVFPSPTAPNVFYVTGSNLGATKETGETSMGSASVWWTWTAPANGEVLIELETYGTTMTFPWLNLYSGATLATLTRITPRVEFAGAKNYHDARFPVTAGTSYAIWVASRGGIQGTYTLRGTFEAPPANDHFANRTRIENSSFLMQYGYVRQSGWTVCATKETGEPWHGGINYSNHGGQSAWWTWTAPASGMATVGVLPLRYVFSSLVGVYTGTAVNNLSRIGNAYSTCTAGSADVSFAVTEGTTYHIAIDGDGSGEYELTLSVRLDTSAPTVTISYPTGGQVLGRSALTVSGTTADPAAPGSINYSSGVNLVEVRLNGGAWLAATGTSAWSRVLTLPDGPNLIEARARDAVGNYSAFAAVNATHGTSISAVRIVAGQAQVTFPSVLGNSYQIEWVPTLTLPLVWTPLPPGLIPGTGLPMTFTDPSAVGQPQRFYRLMVVEY
ncbi:MAG: hypothetical protein NTW21_39925 [Verrucomicrobia bacterium]|nr:hypothetical protein [Verrucomicrobiota bacterium]